MDRNKMNNFKWFSLVIIIFFFGIINSYAQEIQEIENTEENNNSMLLEQLYDDIQNMNNKIILLDESTRNTNDVFNRILERSSKLQIWQIISTVSMIIIAVSVLVAILFLLLKKNILGIQKNTVGSANLMGGANVESTTSEVSASEFKTLKIKFDEIQTKLNQLSDKVDLQLRESSGYKSNISSLQAEINENRQKITKTEAAVSSLNSDLLSDKEKRALKEEVENDPVTVFNKWAQNPHQVLTKYLFPNPNKIDNVSGSIDKMYKVTGTRRGLGSNIIKIISACQIKDGNYIEYQCELKLL